MNATATQLKALLRPNPAWVALAGALGLTLLGIAAMETVDAGAAAGQQKNLPIALLGVLILALPHPRVLGHLAYPMFALAIVLLIFVLLPFVPQSIVRPRNGARSWIDLKIYDFQPSEMAKVCYILSLGWYLRYRASHRTLRGLLLPFVIMLIPVMLILKQPDLGTAIVFGPALLMMLVAAGAKLRHLISLLLIGAVLVGVNVAIVLYAPPDWQVLQPHQQRRITSMIKLASGDLSEVQTDAYQQYKAMTLSGAGGIRGYGAERSSTLFEHYYLPEAHNDMIFAVIINRWGLLGGLGVMSLYGLVIGGFLATAAMSKEPLARLSCVGFAGIMLTQVVVNMGMTVGLMPITGITLPFVSYGGSSLLFSFAMIGLAINFGSRRASYMARPSFEFDNSRRGMSR